METDGNTNREEEFKEREYSVGEEVTRWDSIVEILGIVLLPCPKNGQGRKHSEIFNWAKAYLCYFRIKPFGALLVSGYKITDDPERELKRWHYEPPEIIDEGWDEKDLFSPNAEMAVTRKIQDLQEMFQETSLIITCRFCKQRNQCIEIIQSLLKQNSSFFSYLARNYLWAEKENSSFIKI